MITPPQEGDPVDQLWRVVAEMVREHNALMNMTLQSGSLGIQGQLMVDGDKSVMQVNYRDS